MFKVDDRQIKRYERDLKTFARKAYPFATKETVNGSAFMAQGFMQEEIRENMVTRNRFTERGVRVEQTRSLSVPRQAAVVGHIADYMATAEFGGHTERDGEHETVIPTSYAAGQGETQPRTRLPTRANKLANINLRKRLKNDKRMSRRQKVFLTALVAANEGDKYVFIRSGEGGASTGIYRVFGKRKRKGKFTQVRMRMVYRMKREATRIPATPTLKPAVARTIPRQPELYAKALRFQLKRHGLFIG